MKNKIKRGTILIAKDSCQMNTGECALIIGKEYTVKELGTDHFVIESEVSKKHNFSLELNGKKYYTEFFSEKPNEELKELPKDEIIVIIDHKIVEIERYDPTTGTIYLKQ